MENKNKKQGNNLITG